MIKKLLTRIRIPDRVKCQLGRHDRRIFGIAADMVFEVCSRKGCDFCQWRKMTPREKEVHG